MYLLSPFDPTSTISCNNPLNCPLYVAMYKAPGQKIGIFVNQDIKIIRIR